jgi:hypothetical protein
LYKKKTNKRNQNEHEERVRGNQTALMKKEQKRKRTSDIGCSKNHNRHQQMDSFKPNRLFQQTNLKQ